MGQGLKHETEAIKIFYLQWATCGVGPPINKVDFIFIPACVNDNHWVLCVFVVKSWAIIILDPLHDETEYPREEGVMVCIFILLLFMTYIVPPSFFMAYIVTYFKIIFIGWFDCGDVKIPW